MSLSESGSFSPKKLAQRFNPHRRALPLTRKLVPLPVRSAISSRSQARKAYSLGTVGSLEVRLARTKREIRTAQKLRYQVFYEEMSAIADTNTLAKKSDRDDFDSICDHLLVIDHAAMKRNKLGRLKPQIVGTYRLLRQDVANRHDGFYTAGEFDIQKLIDTNPDKNFLELGRSCVLKPYRNKKTIELLWHGIWSYILKHKIDIMIGCASIEGTNPDLIADQLSFLHHNAQAPESWSVSALPDQYVNMNRIAAEELNPKDCLRALPPLIKGYLRLGAYIGDGAVIDYQFGTTDVLVIMPVSELNQRYVNYYGADASRYAS